jgi:hypothetical protein
MSGFMQNRLIHFNAEFARVNQMVEAQPIPDDLIPANEEKKRRKVTFAEFKENLCKHPLRAVGFYGCASIVLIITFVMTYLSLVEFFFLVLLFLFTHFVTLSSWADLAMQLLMLLGRVLLYEFMLSVC